MTTDMRMPFAAYRSGTRTFVMGPDGETVCHFKQKDPLHRWEAAAKVSAALNAALQLADDGK